MSVVYNTTLKNTRLTDVVTAIDAGGAGYLEIGDASFAHVLSTIHFNTVCGTVSGGVLTSRALRLWTRARRAPARRQRPKCSRAVTRLSSRASRSAHRLADINLSSTSIVAGQSVTLTSATITHG
jgi:hypothetical protein